MLIVASGNGKGKTTAAIGQAIRAMGHGKRVFFAQFIKCDDYPSGEDNMLRKFDGQLTFVKGGKGFVGICGDKLAFNEHKKAAEETLAAAKDAADSRKYDLIILDEVNVALALKLLTFAEITDFLNAVPAPCDAVFTGRDADARILRRADFVTECIEVKHPFRKKIRAKKGIEY